MFKDIEIYQGQIRAYKSNEEQSDFLIQDILYDTKDFFDNAFESEHYRKRSMNGDLTHDTMLSEDIDEFKADESAIDLYAYSRAIGFNDLSTEIQRRIKMRGKDYAKMMDGLVMNFSGSYTHFLFGVPTISTVSYDITLNYHKENICEVDFEVKYLGEINSNAQNIRLATNLYAADTYTVEGVYFFYRVITDVLRGKFHDCEDDKVLDLIADIRDVVMDNNYLLNNYEDLISEKSLKRLFESNNEDEITIGTEEALGLLVSLKGPIIQNLMESGMIG